MATRVSSPTFVGRRRELDAASAALDRARGGSAAMLLVAGEAGVGKSRFLEQVENRARESGFRVLRGGCVQLGGGGLPFGPIVEAMRDLADQFSPEEFDELLGTGRADLGRLMPGLRRGAPASPATSPDPAGQGRLFEHVLLFLRRLSRLGPLAVLVEDVHWADRSTLELLGFLTQNLHDTPILLVATYRSDEIHRRHPLLPFLAQLERNGRAERLDLERFSRREQAEQLEGILGEQPDPDLVDEIYARARGNAFFAEELLATDASPGRLPDTLREVLIERVATLSEPTRELVRIASAAGTNIRIGPLAAVSGTEERELFASLREALGDQILVEERGDRYAFRHALVQEALYEELLPAERTRLHAAFARALDDERRAAGDDSIAAELAYHWGAAHDLPRAFDASIQAGLAAEAIFAFTDAQTHFERALEQWDQVPDAPARAPLTRVELLVHAADAAEGRSPVRSMAHIRTAIALVDPTIDATTAGLLHERLGEYAVNLPNADYQIGLAAYREAVRLVPAEPPTVARAQVLVGLGKCLSDIRQWPELAVVCEEAVRVANAVGDRRVESLGWARLGHRLSWFGDVDGSLAALGRARDIAADLGDGSALALASSILASSLADLARHADASAVALEAADDAVRSGLAARFGVIHLRHAALSLISLGRWDEAAAVLERAQQYYPSLAELDIEALLVLLEALRGQFSSADRHARRMEPGTSADVGRLGFIGPVELALWQGDPIAARSGTQGALTILDRWPMARVRELGPICALGLRAEADFAAMARARGSESELEVAKAVGTVLLARIRSFAAEVAATRPAFTPETDAFRLTCEAEWSRLAGASNPDLWARAAEGWASLQMPYPRGYALMRVGEAALGHRDRRRAAAALSTARGIAVQLGAAPLRESIEAFAARAGTGSRSDRQEVGRADRLSPRELDVLRLLAAGGTDRDIAEGLFISKKTASVHVAHIKSKLGARSRVEIATSAIAQGLLERHGSETA